MLSILHTLGPEFLNTRFDRRTWVVSSGDGFSAERAREFEVGLEKEREKQRERVGKGGSRSAGGGEHKDGYENTGAKWDIITVRRARRVHQSLSTTPVSALGCLVDCLGVLCGRGGGKGGGSSKAANTTRQHSYPDLILTNGPGTGVIMVLASLILLFFGIAPTHIKTANTDNNTNETEIGSMRTIYIESWARVKKLSLSGRILRFLASRVLVQWRGLGDIDRVRMGQGEENIGVGANGSDGRISGSVSMRVQRRAGDADGVSVGSDRAGGRGGGDSTIWPRRTEYIGAVVT